MPVRQLFENLTLRRHNVEMFTKAGEGGAVQFKMGHCSRISVPCVRTKKEKNINLVFLLLTTDYNTGVLFSPTII